MPPAIIALVVVVPVAWAVITYNRFIRARNMLREAWSGMDVQLKRRHDLIPNLIEVVKGYAGHERGVFEQTATLRGQAMQNTAPADREQSESALSGAIKSLFAVAEAYPDLKASQQFLTLQDNLVEIEDQIQYARRYYNGSVRDFNVLAQSFPSNLIAAVAGFKPQSFFEIELATEREAPQVALP